MARVIKSLDKQIRELKERKRNEEEKQRSSAVVLAKKMFLAAKWTLIYDGGMLQLYVKNRDLAKILKKVVGNPVDSELVFSGEFKDVEPFNLLDECWLDHDYNRETGESKPNDGIECDLKTKESSRLADDIETLAKHLPNMMIDQNVIKYTKAQEKALFRINRVILERCKIKE